MPKSIYLSLAIAACLGFLSCNSSSKKTSEPSSQPDAVITDGGDTTAVSTDIVKGFGAKGQLREDCKPVKGGEICTTIFTAEDQFSVDCEKALGRVTQCGCHDYVCSKNINAGYTEGFDHNSEPKNCVPQDPTDLSCTEVFQVQDQFALDCKTAGSTATQCGCHDFICSTDIYEGKRRTRRDGRFD